MSYISAFINREFGTMMSDGQIDGLNGELVESDSPKIINYNDFLIGITGNQTIFESLNYLLSSTDEDSEELLRGQPDIDFILNAVDVCFKQSIENTYDTDIKALIIGFLNTEPIMYLIQYSLDSTSIEKKVPKEKEYEAAVISSVDMSLNNILFNQKIVAELKANPKNTIPKILESQKYLNHVITKTTDIVNEVVYSDLIKNE